jgi:D-xylose 1-dehydrogenase (NADP+, D-xylono-1,5-lactone-forming)
MPPSPSPPPLNWGVVSTARINDEVLPQIRQTGRAHLLAVASRDSGRAQAYAAAHQIPRWYGTYEALFADRDIDCVYVSVPNRLHAPVAAAALRAGKHVLCEKPLAVSAEEARRLFALAESSGKRLMEAFMYRHHDKTLLLEDLVRRGDLGQLEVIRSWFHFRAQDPDSDIRFRKDLAGGSLRDIGCYCTSFALLLLNEEPTAVGAIARLRNGDVDESFAGVMRFSSGAIAVFDCNMRTEVGLGAIVVGSEGEARLATPWYPHLPPSSIELRRAGDSSVVPTTNANPYLLEVENFCDVVQGLAEPRISQQETVRNLKTMDALAEAAGLPNYSLEPKEL